MIIEFEKHELPQIEIAPMSQEEFAKLSPEEQQRRHDQALQQEWNRECQPLYLNNERLQKELRFEKEGKTFIGAPTQEYAWILVLEALALKYAYVVHLGAKGKERIVQFRCSAKEINRAVEDFRSEYFEGDARIFSTLNLKTSTGGQISHWIDAFPKMKPGHSERSILISML